MKDGFSVRRSKGEIGKSGTAIITDRNDIEWTVPIVLTKKGKLAAAQNEYESDIGCDPSWELRGDLNDAVDEYFNSGEDR